MENCKYIVVDSAEAGPAILLFPAFITHADFARRYYGEAWHIDNVGCRRRILSAGFVRKDGHGKLYPSGGSESLDKKCDYVHDRNLLDRLFPDY